MHKDYQKYLLSSLILLLSMFAALSGCSTTQTVKGVPLPTLVPTLPASMLPEPTATALPRPVPSYQPATVAPPATSLPTVFLRVSPLPPLLETQTVSSPMLTPTLTLSPEPEPTASPEPTQNLTPEALATQAAVPGSERRYVFPVQLVLDGTISYARAHHDYPATDIFCPIGSEFVAPTDGVIDFVSREDLWDAAKDSPALRGGISVALIGDDGVRYYGSHLSQVADRIDVGVRVSAGQVLGLTGKSGNAASTPPHLHFGISHPTTPDDWQTRRGEVSPYPYLKAWERGEMLTPDVGGQ